jgi:hypothetical protein
MSALVSLSVGTVARLTMPFAHVTAAGISIFARGRREGLLYEYISGPPSFVSPTRLWSVRRSLATFPVVVDEYYAVSRDAFNLAEYERLRHNVTRCNKSICRIKYEIPCLGSMVPWPTYEPPFPPAHDARQRARPSRAATRTPVECHPPLH